MSWLSHSLVIQSSVDFRLNVSYKDNKQLDETPLFEDCFVVCLQGSVITRSREASLDVWPMKSAGGWYVLETNYDHWKNPLIVDDRRRPANRCMRQMTQKVRSA